MKYFTIFISRDILYSFHVIYFTHSLSIEPRIFNISIYPSSLKDFSSLLLHLLQLTERTVLSKMYGILEFSTLIALKAIIFFLRQLYYIHDQYESNIEDPGESGVNLELWHGEYFTIFISRDVLYSFHVIYFTHSLSIEPRIFNISIYPSSLKDFSSLLLHLLQLTERTVLSKMNGILEFSTLIALKAIIFFLRQLYYIHESNIEDPGEFGANLELWHGDVGKSF